MKPSEYFKKKLKDCSDKTYFERLEELDLKYIDRKELYKQVKEILDESLIKACLKAMEDKDFIKIYQIEVTYKLNKAIKNYECDKKYKHQESKLLKK